jgi:hypothetical protein
MSNLFGGDTVNGIGGSLQRKLEAEHSRFSLMIRFSRFCREDHPDPTTREKRCYPKLKKCLDKLGVNQV